MSSLPWLPTAWNLCDPTPTVPRCANILLPRRYFVNLHESIYNVLLVTIALETNVFDQGNSFRGQANRANVAEHNLQRRVLDERVTEIWDLLQCRLPHIQSSLCDANAELDAQLWRGVPFKCYIDMYSTVNTWFSAKTCWVTIDMCAEM